MNADELDSALLIGGVQLIPGHEPVGIITQLGKSVKGFAIGDRCVADCSVVVSLFDFPALLIPQCCV